MEPRTPLAAAGRRVGRTRVRSSRSEDSADSVRPVLPAPVERPCPAEVEARLSVLLRWS